MKFLAAQGLVSPFMNAFHLSIPDYMPFFLDPTIDPTATDMSILSPGLQLHGYYGLLPLIGITLLLNSEIALKAAELRALSKKYYKRKLKLPDAIVAATAFLYSAVLVTRNIDDFKHLLDHGLRLWNPFEQSE